MSRPSPTKPIFERPIRRVRPTIFPSPRYWSLTWSSYDGLWVTDVWDTWVLGARVSAYSTTAGANSLILFNFADVTNPTVQSTLNPGLTINKMMWLNANLAAYIHGSGYTLVNLTNKSSPSFAGGGALTSPTCLCYPGSGNLMFIGTSQTVYVVNFTNINSPTSASIAQDSDTSSREALVYNPATQLLYSFGPGTGSSPANNPGDILVVDCSNPAAPVKINAVYGRVLTSGLRSAILWDANTIIGDSTDYGCLVQIDLSSPTTPEIVRAWVYRDYLTLSGIDSRIMARRGDTLYHCEAILNPPTILRRIDFSDLAQPVMVDYFDGDYDTGSPLAYGTVNCGNSGISGRGLLRGLYPVVPAPALDRVTVVNM